MRASRSLSSPGANSSRRSGAIVEGSLRGLLVRDELGAVARRRRALEDLAGLGLAVEIERVLLALKAQVEQLLDLGELLGVRLGDRQQLAPVDAEGLEGPRVGVLVGLVADDQVRDRLPATGLSVIS
jgi:hypothetical protein